jgi:hypothetical protein
MRLHHQNKASLWTTNSWRISNNICCKNDQFTIAIRYKTTDRIVSLKYVETAKYGPLTIQIQYGIIRTENESYTRSTALNALFLQHLRPVFG